MTEQELKKFLKDYREGEVSLDQAVERIRNMPFEDLGFAKIDHHRGLRVGFPEVIYCAGKTVEQCAAIATHMVAGGTDNILMTRASREVYDAVAALYPWAHYHETARICHVLKGEIAESERPIAVVAAGTSDLPVAEEAAVTAWAMGQKVERIYDVGVAGLHRLLAQMPKLREAKCLVVVAGMEGALPSVVAGLVEAPVIAVPTSVGYGANFGGLSALLTMINSCASGISVVNIDNGFGGGYQAALIGRTAEPK